MGRSARVNRVSIHERATFDAADPGAGSTWIHMPAIEPGFITKTQEVDDAQISNLYGGRSPDRATVQSSSYSFSVPFFTGSAAFDGASGDSDPTSFYCQPLWENFHCRAATTIAGTTVASSSGPGQSSALKVTSATGMLVGMALMVGTEVRFITAISGTDITLDDDLGTSSNYDAGTIIYGGFFLRPDLATYAKYIDVNHQMSTHSDMLKKGRVSGLTIDGMEAKSGLKLNWSITGDGFGAGVTPNTMTDNAFTGAMIVAQGGTIQVNGTARACTLSSVNYGFEHSERTTSSTSGATNGRDGWELTALSPTIELESYYSSTDWTAYTGRTETPLSIVMSVGSTNAARARGTLAIFMPNTQRDVSDTRPNNQVGTKATFKGLLPTSAQISSGLLYPIYTTIFGGRP